MTTTLLTTAPPATRTLDGALAAFLRAQAGKNRRPATLAAYRTDLTQFLAWLRETNGTIEGPADVTRYDVAEYLAHLATDGLAGVTRRRKLAAIREFFRYLATVGAIAESPVQGIDTPKVGRPGRNRLTREEANALVLAAAGEPRDYAILQTFLQTGIRVSELVALRIEHVDLRERTLHVRDGKGAVARSIELEGKATKALKAWLAARPAALTDRLFVNRYDDPISERGVQKLLTKYARLAGIKKAVTPHVLRHTFASHKADAGINAYQLREWLGHASVATTQIYVALSKANSRQLMEKTSL
ncbi:MAG TPA: tyrosine-type recombinase/integrase [Thermomicrobiales bacterium]|nr:tyrosine-type recombinase/integrase [Thermomicrobiales bacterium]